MTSSTKSRLSHVFLALTECNGGSLAASGLQMSLKQNRSAALSVEPEIDQVQNYGMGPPGIDLSWRRPVPSLYHHVEKYLVGPLDGPLDF